MMRILTFGIIACGLSTLPTLADSSTFVTYDRSGGFLPIDLSIVVKNDASFVVRHEFRMGERKTEERKGTLTGTEVEELRQIVSRTPVYYAPKVDWLGNDIQAYAMTFGMDNNGCAWTDMSDVPGRVLNLARAIEELTQERKKPEPIEVLDVTLEVEESDPPTLVITAEGRVYSEGWEAHLVKWEYIIPPVDGIWDFELVAVPPRKPMPKKGMEITAKYRWTNYPTKDVKGVRVRGARNTIVKKL